VTPNYYVGGVQAPGKAQFRQHGLKSHKRLRAAPKKISKSPCEIFHDWANFDFSDAPTV
jgi:hypothetical protein